MFFFLLSSFLHSSSSPHNPLHYTPNPGGGRSETTCGHAGTRPTLLVKGLTNSGVSAHRSTPGAPSSHPPPPSTIRSSSSSSSSSSSASCTVCSHSQVPVQQSLCPFHAQQAKGFVHSQIRSHYFCYITKCTSYFIILFS